MQVDPVVRGVKAKTLPTTKEERTNEAAAAVLVHVHGWAERRFSGMCNSIVQVAGLDARTRNMALLLCR